MFLDKNNLEIMFGDRFLVIKIGSLDRRIFSYFPKGLTHDGGQEMNFFLFSVCKQK